MFTPDERAFLKLVVGQYLVAGLAPPPYAPEVASVIQKLGITPAELPVARPQPAEGQPTSARIKYPRMLGEALVAAGIISPTQLEVALREQIQSELMRQPVRLGEILLRRRLITEEQLAAALALIASSPTFPNGQII